MPKVTIYTDGACRYTSGRGSRGGWAALLIFESKDGKIIEKELSGSEEITTHNRMEILAAIKALETLNRPCDVILFSDSQLLINGASKWLEGWRRNNWKRKDGILLNTELWKRLHKTASPHKIQWKWVRGHGNCPENLRVDALAVEARNRGFVTFGTLVKGEI